MKKRSWLFALVLAGIAGCGHHVPKATPMALPEPPPAPREFRAAWVATVGNIDWPTKPGLSTAVQQAEAVAILDRLRELHMNAAILQVRPAADALYDSKIEPWSYFLTGTQGKAPDPYYDPLKFWVDEAHKRGIELHAWFNPFRAKPSGAKYALADNSFAKVHPDLAPEYGGMLWMIPTESAALAQSTAVFLDVVKRYDIDGIHIDDYFYPYPEEDKQHHVVPFADDQSWARYQSTGGKMSRDDWRRDAINQLIHDVYVGTKAQKPWVKFGISPFGLPYGPTMPEGIKGFNQYDKLYADTILWLQKGWIDYWTPQLYWPSDQVPQSFPTLLDYWIHANTMHRNIWPGLFTSKARGLEGKAWPVAEITHQIELTRWRPQSSGHVHFSMKALMGNPTGLTDALKNELYQEPSLVPTSPWLGTKSPNTPALTLIPSEHAVNASWHSTGGAAVWQYALWVRNGSTWHFHVLPANDSSFIANDDMSLGGPVTEIVLSAVDRLGNESGRTKMERPANMKYPWPGLTTRPSK